VVAVSFELVCRAVAHMAPRGSVDSVDSVGSIVEGMLPTVGRRRNVVGEGAV
jgi:hypothetical protein